MFLERNAKGALWQAIPLIRAAENGAFGGRLAAIDAFVAATGLIEGDVAHGSASLFLDFGFAVGAAAPESKGKTGLDGLLQLVVVVRVVSVGLAERQRLVVQRLLYFREQPLDGDRQIGQRSA